MKGLAILYSIIKELSSRALSKGDILSPLSIQLHTHLHCDANVSQICTNVNTYFMYSIILINYTNEEGAGLRGSGSLAADCGHN